MPADTLNLFQPQVMGRAYRIWTPPLLWWHHTSLPVHTIQSCQATAPGVCPWPWPNWPWWPCTCWHWHGGQWFQSGGALWCGVCVSDSCEQVSSHNQLIRQQVKFFYHRVFIIFTHMSTNIHTDGHRHSHMSTRIHTYTQTFTHVYKHSCKCTQTFTHVHKHSLKHSHRCPQAQAFTQKFTHMYTNIHTHVHNSHKCTHTFKHMHTNRQDVAM